MVGRPKEPISLLQAKGKKHLTKEEIKKREADEVRAPDDRIEPPSYLLASQKKRFIQIAEDLVEIGIMTNLDNEALGRYVYAEFMYEKVSKALRKLNCIEDLSEYDKLSKIEDRYLKQARGFAQDLGLTISSRCKLVLPPKNNEPEKPSAEQQLFGGKLG